MKLKDFPVLLPPLAEQAEICEALSTATFIGFTGTPIDKTAYGKGTFKTFGCEDDRGYLHKYSIVESIEDGTTLPLYCNLAPNDMLVPHEIMEKEFLALAETEGIADIEELNRILERAVNLKNFLKGRERVKKVAGYVAEHFAQNVEPLGYKAFLVGVDREACVFYKEALDTILPDGYSEIVFTGNNNDKPHLKKWHLDEKKERQIRKNFAKFEELPKILIVTEKEFFREFKEIEMLYEIISPDAFLRPFMENYTTLSSIYAVVRNAYTGRVHVDRAFQKKTNELVQEHVGSMVKEAKEEYAALDASAIETIKRTNEGKATKVINLIKSIEKAAEENSGDPFLVAMAERAKAVQESFEERQASTEEALDQLLNAMERDAQRKKEQAAKGLDALTFFVFCSLRDAGIHEAERASRKMQAAFAGYPNWRQSEKDLRELRKKVTFAILAEEDDLDKVTGLVENLFMVLTKGHNI